MSPSAAASHPLNMWTGDLGWLGESGPPTLSGKPKTYVWNHYLRAQHLCIYVLIHLPTISRLYFQPYVPPSVRRACCLVSHPTHRACHPGLLWPRCAAGSDVCPRSVKELDPLTWMNRNQLIRLAYNWNKQEGENKKLCRMHFFRALTGTESVMVSCFAVWSPTVWADRLSSPSKSLWSSDKSLHGLCCCRHSLSKVKQSNKDLSFNLFHRT